MAEFPNSVFSPRPTENLPGITFDPDDKKNLFSEDYQALGDEIKAIEESLLTFRKFSCLVTCLDDTKITMVEIFNNTGLTFTIDRSDVGLYRLLPSSVWDTSKVSLNVGSLYIEAGSTRDVFASYSINIRTTSVSFNFVDLIGQRYVDCASNYGFKNTLVEVYILP